MTKTYKLKMINVDNRHIIKCKNVEFFRKKFSTIYVTN